LIDDEDVLALLVTSSRFTEGVEDSILPRKSRTVGPIPLYKVLVTVGRMELNHPNAAFISLAKQGIRQPFSKERFPNSRRPLEDDVLFQFKKTEHLLKLRLLDEQVHQGIVDAVPRCRRFCDCSCSRF